MRGIEVSSAGTSPEAECPVSTDLLEWADHVLVMEQTAAISADSFRRCSEGQEDCLFGSSGRLFLHATGVGRVASNEGDSMVAPVIRSEIGLKI
jgi:hypothetical protein